MNRITLPTPDQTPAATLPLLDAVKKQLGVVPNLMKMVGNSPAALEGYLSLNGALSKGSLMQKPVNASPWPSPNSMAVATAYPHIPISAKTSQNWMMLKSRRTATAIHLTLKPLLPSILPPAWRWSVAMFQMPTSAVKAAGYSQAEIVEIVLHVALNTLTNYINEVAQTEIDFPKIDLKKAA